LADHTQRLLKSLMPSALNQQIPYAEDRKTGFHQRQQFLVEDQKFSEWKPAKGGEVQHRPGRRQTSSFQLENQKSLALQFGANDRLLVAFDLAFER
jgi:hypothetical protein